MASKSKRIDRPNRRKPYRIRGVFAGQHDSSFEFFPYPSNDLELSDTSEFLLCQRIEREPGLGRYAAAICHDLGLPDSARRRLFTLIASHVVGYKEVMLGRKRGALNTKGLTHELVDQWARQVVEQMRLPRGNSPFTRTDRHAAVREFVKAQLGEPRKNADIVRQQGVRRRLNARVKELLGN